MHDVYIDNMIQLFVDCERFIKRAPGIVPLVLHLLVRPSMPDEPIDRNDILAEDKMKAEGAPSEEMRVLGWIIDTRRLLMRLPFDKFTCWSREIENWIDPKRVYVTFNVLNIPLGLALQIRPVARDLEGDMQFPPAWTCTRAHTPTLQAKITVFLLHHS